MKKALVFTGTALLIGLLFCLGSSRMMMKSSYAAYDGEYAEKRLMRNEAPPMPSAPVAESQGFGGLGLKGSGYGGGGRGDEGKMGKKDAPAKRKAMAHAMNDGLASAFGAPAAAPEPMKMAEAEEAPKGGEGGAAAAPATRAWFPETFLFEPLVVTGADGHASVPVKVPDRLTTWHVLALAHSRQGAQAGTTAEFLGTLPTYVDPIIPKVLIAGDEVRLPIQVVNTTSAAVSSKLTLAATGGTLSGNGGAVKVPAEGNQVEYVTLKVPRPGPAALKAVLGDTDAVERAVTVKPAGELETVSTGGTLAAPRELSLDGPLSPLEGSEKVKLLVFPGALSLVRSELSAAPGRGGVAEDAYTLLLAGRAAGLLSSLGATPDTGAIRDISIVAGQRAIRHARSPDVPTAVLLSEAALVYGDNPVMSRLGERLAQQVAASQRPDGTCQGQTGWTLQRLLVTTADCVRAVRSAQGSAAAKSRANAVTIKASGAFERNLARVEDGYTAAAILASGAATADMTDALRKKILDALDTRGDGSKVLRVERGVVRADGYPPSQMEATALAVLALGVTDPASADLGTALLGGYSPYYGWGDGRANLVALRAVVQLFKDPVPANVKIALERDGAEIVAGTLDAAKLQDVLTLVADAPGSSGAHTWKVRSEPAVPGLGFSLTLQAHVPWKDDAPQPGLEMKVQMPKELAVGKAAEIALTVAAPAQQATVLKLALPAGVQADRPGLDQLVAAGRLSHYESEDGALTLHLPGLSAGATFEGSVRVIPTLAGTLHADASSLTPEGRPELARTFKPPVWTIAAK
jgi:hypothetical protein